MIDVRKIFAIVAACVATILVIWLAIAVTSKAPARRVTPATPTTGHANTVRQTVRVKEPNVNTVVQEVTVKRLR